MSYDEDIRTLASLHKARIVALIVAVVSLGLAVAFDSAFFTGLRIVAWLGAAFFAAWEGRVESRIGRDPDGSYLRAVLCLAVAIVGLYLASRE